MLRCSSGRISVFMGSHGRRVFGRCRQVKARKALPIAVPFSTNTLSLATELRLRAACPAAWIVHDERAGGASSTLIAGQRSMPAGKT
jgi:hypothetical protein